MVERVEVNIRQQRADHPALRSSLLGRGQPAPLDHTGLEPLPDKSPRGERAKGSQETVMVNPVERC